MATKVKDSDEKKGMIKVSLTPLQRISLLTGKGLLAQEDKQAVMLMNKELRDVLKLSEKEQSEYALKDTDGEITDAVDVQKISKAKASDFEMTSHAHSYVRKRLRKMDEDSKFREEWLDLWDVFEC